MEQKSFELTVYILDKDRKVIRLNKKEQLGVKWKGSWGKSKKKVIFEKDGKNYQILVVVLLKKYLLEMRSIVRRSKFLAPSNVSWEIYKGYMGEPNNSPEEDEKRGDEGVILTNEWNWGRIAIFLVLVVVAIVFVFWVFRRNSKRTKPIS